MLLSCIVGNVGSNVGCLTQDPDLCCRWKLLQVIHEGRLNRTQTRSLFVVPVFCVHGGPGDGDVCRVPAAQLGVEVGGAAGDDRHLLAADGSFLHLAVCPLRHRPPQHGVSVSESYMSVWMSTYIWPCSVWLHWCVQSGSLVFIPSDIAVSISLVNRAPVFCQCHRAWTETGEETTWTWTLLSIGLNLHSPTLYHINKVHVLKQRQICPPLPLQKHAREPRWPYFCT